MEVSSRSVHDEQALFDEDEAEEDEIVLGRSGDSDKTEQETSKQRLISMAKAKPEFEGLRTNPSGHKIQEIRELMSVPVRGWTFSALAAR
jgi:protein SSD1